MIVLVTGDGDLLPAVKAAKDAGVIVKLVHGCDVQDPQHGLIHRYDRSLWQEADERQAVGDSFFQQFLRP